MRTGGLKCSLFGLGPGNTMLKLTRLQIPTLSRPKLNSHFAILCTPHATPMVLLRAFHTLILVFSRYHRLSAAYGTHSELVEYPSRTTCAGHHNGFGGIYTSALTRNTRAPAGSPISTLTFVLFPPRSCACACSRPRRPGWSTITPPTLRHIL